MDCFSSALDTLALKLRSKKTEVLEAREIEQDAHRSRLRFRQNFEMEYKLIFSESGSKDKDKDKIIVIDRLTNLIISSTFDASDVTELANSLSSVDDGGIIRRLKRKKLMWKSQQHVVVKDMIQKAVMRSSKFRKK